MNHAALPIYMTWASSDDTSPDMLKRIYEQADKSDNVQLLTAIARRKDLTPELEALIASRTELEVLLAWVRRNISNPSIIIERVLKDKRATLMLQLAEQSALPTEVYEAMAKSKSKKVAFALANNESVPQSVIESIGPLVVASVTGEHSGSISATTQLLTSRPYLGKLFVSSTTSSIGLMTAAAQAELDDESLTIAAKRIAAMTSFSSSYLLQNMFETFCGRNLPDSALEALKPLAEKATAENHRDYYARRVYSAAATAVSRIGYDSTALLSALTTAGSDGFGEAYAEAMAAIVSRKVTTESVALAVWRNPATPTRVLSDTLRELERDIRTPVVTETLLRLERDGELSKIVELFDDRIYSYADPDFLVDPLAVIKIAACRDGDAPRWVTQSKIWKADPQLAIRYQPVRTVLTDDQTAQLARDIVAARLTSPVHWELFDGLVADFAGPVHDLLDAVDALVG